VRVLRELDQVAHGDCRRGKVGRRQGAAGGEPSRRRAGEARGFFQLRRTQGRDREGLLLLRSV